MAKLKILLLFKTNSLNGLKLGSPNGIFLSSAALLLAISICKLNR